MIPFSGTQRGNRRGGIGWRTYKPTSLPKPPTDFPPGDGAILKALKREDLSAEETLDEVEISDCQVIASYNWLDRASPTAQVPGTPARWTPLSEPIVLKQDNGKYFRDQNAARSPMFPMEAAVRASLQMRPELGLKAMNICACNSTLGNLLRFARDVKKPFRFWVEIIGGTAFFIRKERSPTELIEDVYGYGHTFPEMYTTWPQVSKGSESHQRVLSYRLSGRRMLVRFGADGYLGNLAADQMSQQPSDVSGKADKPLEDALFDLLRKHPESSGDKLVLEVGGKMIPQKAVFDLKTRSIKKKDQNMLAEEMPRLWLSQIPNFILAFHKSGRFDDIEVKDVSGMLKSWEQESQSDLKKFVQLIDIILDQAGATSFRKLEVRGTIDGVLELREILDDQWSALPDDLHAIWLQQGTDGKVNDAGHARPIGSPARSDDGDEDEDDGKDYTACSTECGYCGRCLY